MKYNFKIAAIVLGISSMSPAMSQGYIYKFSTGESAIYTDKVPASEKREFVVLSSESGVIKKVVEKELNKEEIEIRDQEQAEEKQKQLLAATEKKRDDVLLQTYSSLEDIEKYKEYELSTINQTIEGSIDNIAIYKDRITSLEEIYKRNPNSRKAKEDLEKAKNNLNETQKVLDSSKKLYVDKQNKYEEDRIRYLRVMEQLGQEVAAEEEIEKF